MSGSKSGPTRWRVFKVGPFLFYLTYVAKISDFQQIYIFPRWERKYPFLRQARPRIGLGPVRKLLAGLIWLLLQWNYASNQLYIHHAI